MHSSVWTGLKDRRHRIAQFSESGGPAKSGDFHGDVKPLENQRESLRGGTTPTQELDATILLRLD
jgi:hypothetical protein